MENKEIEKLLSKAISLEDLTIEEALLLYEKCPTNDLAIAANIIRKKIKGADDIVTWQIDRNINITNVCISGCKFCSFHCKIHQTEKSFITTIDQYRFKIDEMIAVGGDQILLQGGLHPKLDVCYYEKLFLELKSLYPNIKLHALGPPEIVHISKISGISEKQCLERLIKAGLDSLPGAGAEILDTEFRKKISPAKCSAEKWLEVMEIAHELNMPTSATMVYGINETLKQRVEHIIKIRDLQSKKKAENYGFIAFIPWVFSTKGTQLEKEGIKSEFSQNQYIRTIAISRIILNNIANIQASWLTVGREAAQICLNAGANDLGSIMIEENVVASTGLKNKMDAEAMQKTITEAGFTPQLRDQLYKKRTI